MDILDQNSFLDFFQDPGPSHVSALDESKDSLMDILNIPGIGFDHLAGLPLDENDLELSCFNEDEFDVNANLVLPFDTKLPKCDLEDFPDTFTTLKKLWPEHEVIQSPIKCSSTTITPTPKKLQSEDDDSNDELDIDIETVDDDEFEGKSGAQILSQKLHDIASGCQAARVREVVLKKPYKPKVKPVKVKPVKIEPVKVAPAVPQKELSPTAILRRESLLRILPKGAKIKPKTKDQSIVVEKIKQSCQPIRTSILIPHQENPFSTKGKNIKNTAVVSPFKKSSPSHSPPPATTHINATPAPVYKLQAITTTTTKSNEPKTQKPFLSLSQAATLLQNWQRILPKVKALPLVQNNTDSTKEVKKEPPLLPTPTEIKPIVQNIVIQPVRIKIEPVQIQPPVVIEIEPIPIKIEPVAIKIEPEDHNYCSNSSTPHWDDKVQSIPVDPWTMRIKKQPVPSNNYADLQDVCEIVTVVTNSEPDEVTILTEAVTNSKLPIAQRKKSSINSLNSFKRSKHYRSSCSPSNSSSSHSVYYRSRSRSPAPRKHTSRSSRGKKRRRYKDSSSRSKSRSYSRSRSRSRDSRSRSRDSRSRSRSRSWLRSRSNSWAKNSFNRRRKRSRSPFRERQQVRSDQMSQIEERRVIFVGKIPDGTTKTELRQRFYRFGDITEVSVHFRDVGDNYGFVTFAYKCDAYEALRHGNDDPKLPKFDLCFGGRRQFCNQKYADLDDSEGSYCQSSSTSSRTTNKEVDFDSLLRAARAQLEEKRC